MNKLMYRFVATTKKKKTRCLYWHLREMHLIQLYASQIYKTILANGLVCLTTIALRCFPCVTRQARLKVSPEISEIPLR